MTENLNSEDYYEILGVDRKVDKKELKSVYKKLAKQYHPDLHQNEKEKYVEYFKKISEAYEILNDDEKRQKYDIGGKQALKPEEQMFRSPQDVFSEIFGRFGFNNFGFDMGQRREEIYEYPLSVSYKHLYKGKTIKFKITRQNIVNDDIPLSSQECQNCCQVCIECKGLGRKTATVQCGFGFIAQQTMACPTCKSLGKVLKPTYKYQQCEEIVSIDIKPGSFAGQRYILKEKGDMIPGQSIKDLHVIITEQPEDGTTRHGLDLYREYEIGLGDALVGTNILFEHYDGQKYNITLPGIINPQDKKCVTGLGFPDINSPSTKGNLYLIFKIKFPSSIDEKTKYKLRQIFTTTSPSSKYPTLKCL